MDGWLTNLRMGHARRRRWCTPKVLVLVSVRAFCVSFSGTGVGRGVVDGLVDVFVFVFVFVLTLPPVVVYGSLRIPGRAAWSWVVGWVAAVCTDLVHCASCCTCLVSLCVQAVARAWWCVQVHGRRPVDVQVARPYLHPLVSCGQQHLCAFYSDTCTLGKVSRF